MGQRRQRLGDSGYGRGNECLWDVEEGGAGGQQRHAVQIFFCVAKERSSRGGEERGEGSLAGPKGRRRLLGVGGVRGKPTPKKTIMKTLKQTQVAASEAK